MLRIGHIVVLCLLSISGLSCNSDIDDIEQLINANIKEITHQQMAKIRQKNIYFGYRSVGDNIINGLKQLKKDYSGIEIKVTETGIPGSDKKGYLIHHWINPDDSPEEIVSNYKNTLKQLSQPYFDIAFLRFTPFYGKKDVNEIIEDYQVAFNDLKQNFPDTVFVHVTFPLNHAPINWRTRLKIILKKEEIWEFWKLPFINEYNQRLRETFKNKEPFFDLAELQSTYPDGKRSTFEYQGHTYYHMVSEYTSDWTHLNEIGQKLIASHFLLFVANL